MSNAFRVTDIISVVAIVCAVAGAVLSLCDLMIAGIVTGAVGLIGAVTVKLLCGRTAINARIANIAFVLGMVCAAFVVLAPVIAAIIDGIFESAQI